MFEFVGVKLGVCVGDPVPLAVPGGVDDTDGTGGRVDVPDTEEPGKRVRVAVAVPDTEEPSERVWVAVAVGVPDTEATGARVRDPVAELDDPPVRVLEATAVRVVLRDAEDTGETGRVRVPVLLTVRLGVGDTAAWVRLPVLVGLRVATRVGDAVGSCA